MALIALTSALALPAFASGWSPCPGFERGASNQHNAVFFSPYTHHWRYSEEHRNVVLIGLQRHLPNNRSCGISFFTNSFGQPSLYAFTGWTWNAQRLPNWQASVTAGMLYGYVAPHEDKVPLNHRGFSPAVIPSIGYRLNDRTVAEMHILGTAALMFGVSRDF
ncbi:MAG: hypothetical protein LRY31_02300 [Burkholderiaceae bacterium]|nr:hypothetical protein [Burkholderiaceae bacterium]